MTNSRPSLHFPHILIVDDPGGTNGELKKQLTIVSAATTTINNCTNVDSLKSSTRDQFVTSVATSTTISSSPVTSTSSTSSTLVANDSKYLHKKFKKFCATVDSSSQHQTNNSHLNNNLNANSTPTIDASLNNNSEIVVNKNNNSNSSSNNWQSSSNHPKHSLTTEEEKQLVKDILDINNENFMHQSVNNLYHHHHHLNNSISVNAAVNNQSTSSFLITPAAAVTTLGNHNSNFQQQLSSDHRQKVTHPEPFNSSLLRNENFVIVNGQQPQPSIESSHNQAPPTSTINSSVPTTVTSSTATSTASTPGRYICPYCQLNCAKPSVLQKHIRAHTNERPFPCTLCGFAFKTKSNLYKHRR